MTNEKEICFLDSFRADTSIVPEVIDRLYIDLKKMAYPKDEIDEIVLSMDEAITNAVQETICTINEQYCHSKMNREITVRYNIDNDEFNATVIDHGKGLDIDKMLRKIPDVASDQYHQEIYDYIKTQEKNRLKVRLNGKELFLNGIGAGLRIILSFMDTVTIDLLDTQTVVSETVSEFTDGTILNIRRKRRYS